jgi:hypothetical protein
MIPAGENDFICDFTLEVVNYMEMSKKVVSFTGAVFRQDNRLMSVIAAFVIALINFAPFSAYGEYKQLDAHEHGIAILNTVLEGKELVIEFISPAANIVGFEHEPATEQDGEAINNARTMLMDGVSLFRFPVEAECVLEHAEVETDLEHNGHEENGEGHSHDSGEHHHDNHDGDGHGDFRVEYHFHVGNPTALTSLEVLFMQLFPAIERMKVQVASQSAQTAVELTPDMFRVEL